MSLGKGGSADQYGERGCCAGRFLRALIGGREWACLGDTGG